jgi:hypothetical protein
MIFVNSEIIFFLKPATIASSPIAMSICLVWMSSLADQALNEASSPSANLTWQPRKIPNAQDHNSNSGNYSVIPVDNAGFRDADNLLMVSQKLIFLTGSTPHMVSCVGLDRYMSCVNRCLLELLRDHQTWFFRNFWYYNVAVALRT